MKKPKSYKKDKFDNDNENIVIAQPEKEKKIVSVKDVYLPAVIVRTGICKNNGEARNLIRNVGVKVNGKLTQICEATNAKLQFVLEYDNIEYEIFKV